MSKKKKSYFPSDEENDNQDDYSTVPAISTDTKDDVSVEKTKTSITETKTITMGGFLSTSKKVREFSPYVKIGFKRWYTIGRRTDPDKKFKYHMTENKWTELFIEFTKK